MTRVGPDVAHGQRLIAHVNDGQTACFVAWS
jgi:hypothetical protein